MKKLLTIVLLVFGFAVAAQAQDPGWPREISGSGFTMLYYQPQVDDWSFTAIHARMVVSVTQGSAKPVLGVLVMQGSTAIDAAQQMVTISNIQITNSYFPSLSPAAASQEVAQIQGLIPSEVYWSVNRLVASVPKQTTQPAAVQVNNTPPKVFVSYSPAILLGVEGAPVRAPIPKTNLEYVVNTSWHLIYDKNGSQYYLLVGEQWLTSGALEGPWAPASELPKDMHKLPEQEQWSDLKTVIPPPQPKAGTPVPGVFYSTSPADVILFDGQPVYSGIAGTQLSYATNSNSFIFVYAPTNAIYLLTSGRWFSASSFSGPWTYATPNLPADFAQIPQSSPPGMVLDSVPGTEEAKDAVLLAQIPTTVTVNPTTAAAQAKVTYDGAPQFAPIQGTTMSYATNTAERVIQVGDVYYLCLNGIWFLSANSNGPWQTASSVPQQIYTIPASSPVYNVTYVTQVTNSSGSVQASTTAGYFGAFVMGAALGAVVACGSGYYYPPYVGFGWGGYPSYYPYPATYGATPYYNTRTGAYGYSQSAYGPYGSATRGASYNPYTGTSSRYGSVSTPYGTRSAGQAYNPYTGAYGQTRQGSNGYSQWGSSTVSQGGKSATSAHYASSQGTWSGAKSSNGDMYAGHDGNVYKNTGSGWQKYNGDGSWNDVQHPQDASSWGGHNGGSGSTSSSMNSDWASRQRGDDSSSRWGGGGGGGGGDDRFGGGGGGGGDRFGGGGGWGGGRGSWGGGGRRF